MNKSFNFPVMEMKAVTDAVSAAVDTTQVDDMWLNKADQFHAATYAANAGYHLWDGDLRQALKSLHCAAVIEAFQKNKMTDAQFSNAFAAAHKALEEVVTGCM